MHKLWLQLVGPSDLSINFDFPVDYTNPGYIGILKKISAVSFIYIYRLICWNWWFFRWKGWILPQACSKHDVAFGCDFLLVNAFSIQNNDAFCFFNDEIWLFSTEIGVCFRRMYFQPPGLSSKDLVRRMVVYTKADGLHTRSDGFFH